MARLAGKLMAFKNTFRKSDSQPAYTGSGEISKEFLREMIDNMKESSDDLIMVEVAAWEYEDRNGNPYFSISFSSENPEYPIKRSNSQSTSSGDSLEDVPF